MALGDVEVKGDLEVEGDTVLAALTASGAVILNGASVLNGTCDLAGGALNTDLVTDLNADKVDSADKSIDGTLAGNSDSLIPTEKAVKTYADARKAECVALTGDQTVAGVKTFSSDPVATVPSVRDQGTGAVALKCKIVEIGDWNMDSTVLVYITHGLDFTKIRNVSAIIRADSDANRYQNGHEASGTVQFSVGAIGSSQVTLIRLTGGIFDASSWDDTSYNRGWVMIWYEA